MEDHRASREHSPSVSVCNSVDESGHIPLSEKSLRALSPLLHISIDQKVNGQLLSVQLEVRLPLGGGDWGGHGWAASGF